MKKFCENCGNEINESKFCPFCGYEAKSRDVNPDNSEKELPNYKTEERLQPPAIVKACVAAVVGAIALDMTIQQYSEIRIHNNGLFMFMIDLILLAGCLVSLLLELFSVKIKVYVITCPSCGRQTIYPVGAEGFNCTCCEKRLIQANGRIICPDIHHNGGKKDG